MTGLTTHPIVAGLLITGSVLLLARLWRWALAPRDEFPGVTERQRRDRALTAPRSAP